MAGFLKDRAQDASALLDSLIDDLVAPDRQEGAREAADQEGRGGEASGTKS